MCVCPVHPTNFTPTLHVTAESKQLGHPVNLTIGLRVEKQI